MNTYCLKFETGKQKLEDIFNWIDGHSNSIMIEGEIIYKFNDNDLYVFFNSNGLFNPGSDYRPDYINLTGKGSFATDLAIQCDINEFYFYELSDEKKRWKLTYFENFNTPKQNRICKVEKAEDLSEIKLVINWLTSQDFDGSVG